MMRQLHFSSCLLNYKNFAVKLNCVIQSQLQSDTHVWVSTKSSKNKWRFSCQRLHKLFIL